MSKQAKNPYNCKCLNAGPTVALITNNIQGDDIIVEAKCTIRIKKNTKNDGHHLASIRVVHVYGPVKTPQDTSDAPPQQDETANDDESKEPA